MQTLSGAQFTEILTCEAAAASEWFTERPNPIAMISNGSSPSVQASPVAPLQRYSTVKLQFFQALLRDRLADTQASLSHLEQVLVLGRGSGTDDTYSSSNLTEDGKSTLEREEAAMMVARLRRYERDLINALARIEQGTYGICRVTGRLIPEERLHAMPTATVCIEVKKS